MRRRKFSQIEKLLIVQRAKGCCEYCGALLDFSPESFEVEHITPLAKGGTNELENLALSCGGCNNRKGDRTHGCDPLLNTEVPLFNPRLDVWTDHFDWGDNASTVRGKTSVGRATVEALHLNRSGLVNFRQALIRFGVHPPLHLAH